ncbi:MAG: DUF6159 family protein [Longimicrobiales bacterium]|nr:DUF6159 family protein [Longimicrobiales bacterium]
MAGSLSNSWNLVKASTEVLRLDRELLVFPLLSGIATILVMVSYFGPIGMLGGWELLDAESGGYLSTVILFGFYLIQYFVIFFFNTALVGAALIRMEGGDPTVSDGMRIAWDRLPAILGYAAVAATVGMLLRTLSERLGFIGRAVVGMLGIGWSLATYLTVPVLVSRDVGPIDAVKESAELFRRTWGEQVVGNIGMGWATFMMAGSWTIIVAGMVAGAAALGGGAVVLGPVLALSVLGYLALGLFISALKGIYTAALYRYASTGDPGIMEARVVEQAFRPKI